MCLIISYYEDIQKMPAISEQDMHAILKEESQVCFLSMIFMGLYLLYLTYL